MASLVGIHSAPGSSVRGVAEALAWLWRLGPVADQPATDSVAVGDLPEAEHLTGLLSDGAVRGAVVFAGAPGGPEGPVPARGLVRGVTQMPGGQSVSDAFVVFREGPGFVNSRLGIHAVLKDRMLIVGADPIARWGRLSLLFALEAIARFLVEPMDASLLMLPPVGCIRFDDLPATAQQQMQGTDRSDSRAHRRIEALVDAYADADVTLNIATPARGLRDGVPAPSEVVWPRSIAALRDGVRAGVLEPVCHGLLHLDQTVQDRVEPREFLALDRTEAESRLASAIDWQESVLGRRPGTFVAPGWGYSPGALEAAANLAIPAWRRAAPAALSLGGNPAETLIGPGGIGGIRGVRYEPLAQMAALGLPPTPVLHGGLLDDRLTHRVLLDSPHYARLLVKRDALRLPAVGDVEWTGAGELARCLRNHDQAVQAPDGAVLVDGSRAVLRDRSGSSPVGA